MRTVSLLIVAAASAPITRTEKAEIASALTDALGALQHNGKGASKYETCTSLFPHGAPLDAATNPSWQSCKHVISTPSMASLIAKSWTRGKDNKNKDGPFGEVDKEGYEADWQTEHRSEPYPESSRGLQHHPDYHQSNTVLASLVALPVLALLQ